MSKTVHILIDISNHKIKNIAAYFRGCSIYEKERKIENDITMEYLKRSIKYLEKTNTAKN